MGVGSVAAIVPAPFTGHHAPDRRQRNSRDFVLPVYYFITVTSRSDEHLLDALQRETFGYFLNEYNPANGLVKDKTSERWPASIAAVGLALSAYPVGVEIGWLSRDDAIKRTLATLR